MKQQIFKYNGSPVTFQLGESTMVNATEMAKPFGDSKRAKNWLTLSSTKEFLDVLSKGRNLPLADLLIVVKGGNNAGTWMHEDVALEFARWLSPQFAIWCNDRIKELLKHGVTATPQTIDSMIADPDNAIRLLTALRDERKALQDARKEISTLTVQKDTYQSENRRLLHLIDNKDKEMKEQAPLVEHARNALDSFGTFTSTQIAKEFGMSAQALHRFLKEKGVMFRQWNQWFLYARYQDKGYVKTREHTYTRSDGKTAITLTTVWTERGRMFIHSLFRR